MRCQSGQSCMRLLAPDVQPVGDAFALHDAGHPSILAEADIPFARRQHVAIAVAIAIHIPAVAQRGNVVHGIVEISSCRRNSRSEMVISNAPLMATHFDEDVRPLQREIHGVVAAEAAAGSRDPWPTD